MNHKRKRPAHQRAGCKRCKPWKDERDFKTDRFTPAERRRLLGERDERRAAPVPRTVSSSACRQPGTAAARPASAKAHHAVK